MYIHILVHSLFLCDVLSAWSSDVKILACPYDQIYVEIYFNHFPRQFIYSHWHDTHLGVLLSWMLKLSRHSWVTVHVNNRRCSCNLVRHLLGCDTSVVCTMAMNILSLETFVSILKPKSDICRDICAYFYTKTNLFTNQSNTL